MATTVTNAWDPKAHPERFWPANAPITVEEFRRIRYAQAVPLDPNDWDWEYVATHYSLDVLDWAARMQNWLYRQSPRYQEDLERVRAGLRDGIPFEGGAVAALAEMIRRDGLDGVRAYCAKRRRERAQDKWFRRRSFWFRLTFALIMSGLTMAFFAFANYSPQLFQKHHVWPLPAAAYPDLLAIFLVIALLYFWRIRYWQSADLTEYAIGLAVGLCAAVVFWHHGFPAVPYWSPAKAWGEALTGGLLVAIWVSHHVNNAVEDGDFVNLIAILLVAAPIVAILALI